MAFKLKSGNTTPFKQLGSSPAKDMKTGKYEHSFESPAKAGPETEQFDIDKHLDKQPVDPDAPGTPGKPGYEPPVKRSDLDEAGKKKWDELRKKDRPDPTWPGTDEYRKPKDIPEKEYKEKGIKKSPAKQKESKVDKMRKMVIANANRPEYDAEWEARSDKAKKATKNRSSIQEHQLTLKQLDKQKKEETNKAKTKHARKELGI